MNEDYVWKLDHEDEWRFQLDGEEYVLTFKYDANDRTIVQKELMDKLLRTATMYKYADEKEPNTNG